MNRSTLATASFESTRLPATPAARLRQHARIYGRGRLSAVVAVLSVNHQAVANWLPAPLELAPQQATSASTHPVIVLFGRQLGVHLNLLSFFRLSYRELAVLVPYTRFAGREDGYSGPFVYASALYLDRFWPTLLGRTVLAAPKALGRFESHSGRSSAVARDGQRLAEVVTEELDRPATDEDRTLLMDLLQQPNVCVGSNGCCRFFGADWRLGEALLRPLSARWAFGPDLVPSGLELAETPARADGRATPTFRLGTDWLLDMPEPWTPKLARWREARGRLASCAP